MERELIDLKIKMVSEVIISTYADMGHSIEHFNTELIDHINGGYNRPWCEVALENLKCVSVEPIQDGAE